MDTTTTESAELAKARKVLTPNHPHEGHIRCAACGHSFMGPAVFEAHRNAFPPAHPLRRCLDAMEMQALDYQRRASGAWVSGIGTQLHSSQARRLATVRQQLEHYELTGEVLPHQRMVPASVPAFLRAESETDKAHRQQPEDTADVYRRREQTRLRVRRHRAKRVTRPTPGRGSVTWRRGKPRAASQ